MAYDRKLSPKFMADLKIGGILDPLLNRVKEDHTLLLAIRNNYIDIYYRGGRLCGISQSRDGASYTAEFDKNFDKSPNPLPIAFPFRLNDDENANTLVRAIPELKYRMDIFYAKSGKSEREFQQLVVRENNYTSDTHYFIVDIEVAVPGSRYDMLAVRWLSHERNRPGTLVPALIEMKYGIEALDGVAGMEKHMRDARALIKKEAWGDILNGLETQLNQLVQLELLTFKSSGRVRRLEIDRDAKPELIFLLAGYNPGSSKLSTFLDSLGITEAEDGDFNLLFFAASFAGYGMYREAMLTLKQFKTEVSRLFKLASRIRSRTQGLDPVETLN